jgi:YebC/PmpR family DNA-binding regulatory protein
LAGDTLEEILYEGYGAGGVAVMCDILTNNRNRTAPEVRKIFELSAGKLGGTGCVAWMFENKGLFIVPGDSIEEDRLLEVAIEAGADDVQTVGDKFEVTCDPTKYREVTEGLAKAGVTIEASKITRIAKNMVDVSDEDEARKILKLMERLEDHDDVQSVSSNFNIPDAVMAQVGEE